MGNTTKGHQKVLMRGSTWKMLQVGRVQWEKREAAVGVQSRMRMVALPGEPFRPESHHRHATETMSAIFIATEGFSSCDLKSANSSWASREAVISGMSRA